MQVEMFRPDKQAGVDMIGRAGMLFASANANADPNAKVNVNAARQQESFFVEC